MKIIIYLLLCVIALGACQTDKSEKEIFVKDKDDKIERGEVLTLYPPMQKGANNFDNIVDSVWYLPLSDSVLIAEIDEIKYDSEKLFIGDYKQGALFVFDLKGNCIGKIEEKGEGPNQYKRLCDFDISPLDHKIYLLDGDLGKILVYNPELTIEKVLSMPEKYLDHFSIYDERCIYTDAGFRTSGNSRVLPNVVMYDMENMDAKLSFFHYNDKLLKYHNRNPEAFFRNNDSLYYWTNLGSSIYLCTDSTLKEVVRYDLGDYAIPSSIYGETISRARKIISENHLAFIDKFYDLGDWYYSRISRSHSSAHFFYNKNTKKDFIDLSFMSGVNGNFITPDVFAISNNILCGQLDAKQYALIVGDSAINDDNNPILIFYRLKAYSKKISEQSSDSNLQR
jgi:hypothetical protein